MRSVYLKAPLALFQGLHLCLRNKEIRKLSLRPWLIGIICYAISAIAALYAHGYLVSLFSGADSGAIGYIRHAGIWLLVSVGLLVISIIFNFTIVVILAGVFETDIAKKVLEINGVHLPEQKSDLRSSTKQIFRDTLAISAQLVWLAPWAIMATIIGFIPFLTPIAFLILAWLLGYQFLDIVLMSANISFFRRLKFSIVSGPLITLFGLSLVALWAIPFVGAIMHPVAVAGGAWLLASSPLLNPPK